MVETPEVVAVASTLDVGLGACEDVLGGWDWEERVEAAAGAFAICEDGERKGAIGGAEPLVCGAWAALDEAAALLVFEGD
jgi:hypothetical protein